MIETETLLLNEIDEQLESASILIDLGEFDDSFKLCEEIRRNLDALPYKSEIHSLLLFKLAGFYVDLGNRDLNEEAARIGLNLLNSNNFEDNVPSYEYYYNLANAKSNFISQNNDLNIDATMVQEYSEINALLWKAVLAHKNERKSVHPYYLINLGLNLQKQYRISEALAIYDQVISLGYDIPEVWVGRSECLSLLRKVSETYSIKQLDEIATGYLQASKSQNVHSDAKKGYAKFAKDYFSRIKNINLSNSLDPEDESHHSKQEYLSLSEYRRWCLDSYLSLSEHGLYCKCYGSARDNLTIPLTTRGISGEFIYPMEKVLNRLKSEFGLARLMLYEYKTSSIDEYLEDEACYSELYDNELLGINIEKIRTAFRICFGILDKIATSVDLVFEFKTKGNVYFPTFWRLDIPEKLDNFRSHNNAGLIALYSIACDLNHNLQGELNFYKQWRNALEHSFVFIYKGTKPNETQSAINYYGEPEFISEDEFVESAKHVLQLTRSAIFSFVYAVRIKAEKDTPKEAEFLYQKRTIQRKNYVSNTDS